MAAGKAVGAAWWPPAGSTSPGGAISSDSADGQESDDVAIVHKGRSQRDSAHRAENRVNAT